MEKTEQEMFEFAMSVIASRKELCLRVLRTNSNERLIERRQLAVDEGDVYTLDYCEIIMKERGLI